jgi:hypothetical protein
MIIPLLQFKNLADFRLWVLVNPNKASSLRGFIWNMVIEFEIFILLLGYCWWGEVTRDISEDRSDLIT